MSVTSTIEHSPVAIEESVGPTDAQRTSVFLDWCLRREAFILRGQYVLVYPLALLGCLCLWNRWPGRWYSTQGRDVLNLLFITASILIVVKGGAHAAQAVSWEASPDMRDLVRLTGIGPFRLLACTTLARWWTIVVALFVLVPFACFARLLGGVSSSVVVSSGLVLLMLTVLTAAFAMMSAVATTGTESSAATNSAAALILMVIYHVMFGVCGALVYLVYCLFTNQWGTFIPVQSWWHVLFDFTWRSTPYAIASQVVEDANEFNPLAPTYWIHFITAAFCFRMAHIVMFNRFRANSRTIGDASPMESPKNSDFAERPRCPDFPFFWKDAYFLAGGLRSQRQWSKTYGLLALGLVVSDFSGRHLYLPMILGMVIVYTLPLIFAQRFDGLLAAEFEHQTWQTLMLLPIDRRQLIWSKFRAVAWEHYLAILPYGVAMVIAWPVSPFAAPIAILLALFACHSSIYAHLLSGNSRERLSGLRFLALLIIFGPIVWVNFGLWAGLAIIVMTLLVFVLVFHVVLAHGLRKWTES